MYNFFKKKYPNTTIKYEYYRQYFVSNFKLRFGRPPIDSCSFCEEKNVIIKNPHSTPLEISSARNELNVHLRCSKKFTIALQKSTKLSQKNDNIAGLVFDYMQNLQLPKIPVQEIFYLRQLTVNVFCIYNTKT